MARIEGTEGSDILVGTAQDDEIFGLGGDDLLAGNEGSDRLTGGAGIDRFSFRVTTSFFAPIDSTSTAQDLVTDFQGAGEAGGDTISLTESTSRRMVFEGALAAMPAIGAPLGFGGNGFTEVFYAFDGADTVLFADSDDDGVFDADDFAVRFSGHQSFVLADFGSTPFVLRGTSGKDTIAGTAGADTIFGLGGNDTISGGAGNDIIDGGEGGDTIDGGAGNDTIRGGAGNDVLLGGAGRDNITGGDGNDIIDGGAGNDPALSGGNGNDIVYGGEGNDTMDGDAGNDVLFGGPGNDDIFGEDGNDMLFGEDGNDELFGDAGADTLMGGNGDDELEGDAGGDTLVGGAGDDEFTFFLGEFNPSSPLATPDQVLDFAGAGADGGDLLAVRTSQVVFRGEADINPKAGAPLPGAGNGLNDMVYAFRNGHTWLLVDDNDNGRLDATDFAVDFVGLHAFTQADFVRTGFVIAGTDGDDTLFGTEGDDEIYGLGGDDSIFGMGGNDLLFGGAGNDLLDGGPGGFDNLDGGDGDDTLTLQNSDIGGNASGGAGNDLLIGSDSPFAFSALDGGAGNDTMRAGANDTSMVDFDGGDDIMEGGAGDDSFTGGSGTDRFVFGAVWTTPDSGFQDIIWDFEDGVEKIDLRGSGLTADDITIADDDFGFSAIVTSSAGRIEVFGQAGQITTDGDFLFG